VLALTDATERIGAWYICGPFPPEGSRQLEARWALSARQALPSAPSFRAEQWQGAAGKAAWKEQREEEADLASADPATGQVRALRAPIVDLLKPFPLSVNRCAYALAFVDSPVARTRSMLVGSDDSVAIWLNGREIHRSEKIRPIVPDEDFAIAEFRKGLNVLLLRVGNDRTYWGFTLRLAPPGSSGAAPPPIPLDSILK
jgi:hypothetical protein